MFFKQSGLSKKTVAALISSSLVLGMTGCSSSNNTQNNTTNNNNTSATTVNFGLTQNVKDGAMLHAWCWDFNTIKENMSDIAAAGFTGIQTNAIQACVDPQGYAIKQDSDEKGFWYYQYQPTDFTIGNYSVGTRDEFKAMCDEAEKYGIKIIVDVVPNHTGSRDLVAKELADSVGGIENLYHSHGFTSISNYGDRTQCTTYASGGLSDIDTENDGYQDYFIKFLNDCIECGADGFRYDSAKHIGLPDDPQDNPDEANDFWERVTSDEITNRDEIYIYGEILQGDNERLDSYLELLDGGTASSYGGVVRGAAHLHQLDAQRVLNFNSNSSPDKLVTWVESHDNYANDKTYTVIDDEEVVFGWALIASIGKGTPLFFSRPYGASKDDYAGTINRIGFKGGENYKHPVVVATNRFRNAMVGEEVETSNINDDKSILYIERGSKGVVIMNGSDAELDVNLDTKLADGTYTDRSGVNGDFTVSGGKLTGKVSVTGVAVLYNDGYLDIPATAVVSASQTSEFYGSDTEIKLSAQNATSSQYAIITKNSDGKFDEENVDKKDFKDGDVIKIENDIEIGDSVILKLFGTNESGVLSTICYRLYKKDTIKSGDVLKFMSNKNWSKDVYAYIYTLDDDGNKTEVSAWPGEKMTNTTGFAYEYAFKSEFKKAYVIFNDGTEANKRPLKGDDGYEIDITKNYS